MAGNRRRYYHIRDSSCSTNVIFAIVTASVCCKLVTASASHTGDPPPKAAAWSQAHGQLEIVRDSLVNRDATHHRPRSGDEVAHYAEPKHC